MTRLANITKGIAALVAMAAILVGIPWLLWTIGGTPGLQIVDALTDELASSNQQTSDLLAGTLGLIAWACWAQVAYAIALEILATIRGTVTRTARLLPGLQGAASRLVAASTLVTASFATTPAVAASPIPTAGASSEPVPELVHALAPVTARAAKTEALQNARPASLPTYQAGHRETFWSIAETTLGDGMRWSQVRDANLGRTMRDGTTITAATETVLPGWELLLPSDAVPPTPAAEAQPDVGVATADQGFVEVEPGDHFWSIAETALTEAWGRTPADTEIAPYWIEVIRINEDRLLPPGDPNLIYPEQQLELPPLPADPTANPADEAVQPETSTVADGQVIEPPADEPDNVAEEPVGTATPNATAAPSVDTTEADQTRTDSMPALEPASLPATATASQTDSTAEEPPTDRPAAAEDRSDENETAAALGLGALATAAGVLTVSLRRRRRHQIAKRPPDTAVPPTSEQTDNYLDSIRAIADTEAARWIEATNRLITHRLAQTQATRLPAVIAMRAGKHGVELVLDEPLTPVDGFVGANDLNTAWRLDPGLELAQIESESEGAQPYCLALVPVGSTDSGDLYLDLEQLAALSVEGELAIAEDWFRTVATAAATSPWSDLCEIVLIDGPDDLDRFPQVTNPTDPQAWADHTILVMQRLHERLESTPYHQRVEPGEIHHPTIVLVGPNEPEIASKLADAATLVNAPLAVVAACPLPTDERIHLDPDNSTLEPLGLSFQPALTAIAEVAAVVEAVETSHPENHGKAEVSTEPTTVDPDREPVEQLIARINGPRLVEVKILTPKPKVTGLAGDPGAKQLSVICYLAYRRAVSSQRLRDTFWPNATSRKTADNAISSIRSMLGHTSNGDQRLTQATNTGVYEISEDIGCDWTRVQHLLDAVPGRPNVEQALLLRASLELVDGQIGSDVPSSQFAWLTEDHNVYMIIETALVDAAHRLAELALDSGDADLAEWAANKGLAVVDGSEAMYRIKMRVAAIRSDCAGLKAAYLAAQRHAEALGPWASVDRETEALWVGLS